MEKIRYTGRTPLAACEQISIEDDLLEALVRNKRKKPKYHDINPIVCGGHGRNDVARQVLSYVIRLGLGIVRRPGTYDIRMSSKIFERFSNEELLGAAADASRIYQHTYAEMSKYSHNTIPLVRGICGIEAAVCARLLEEVHEEKIPYFFQTVNFFNHISGGFSRQIEVRIDCPIDWVWASAYTLKDLELPGSCEEFIVACRSIDGILTIPKENFEITPSFHEIEDVTYPYHGLHFQNMTARAISSLTVSDDFEPDDFKHYEPQYVQGRWEKILSSFGRWIDKKNSYKFYKGRILFKLKRKY